MICWFVSLRRHDQYVRDTEEFKRRHAKRSKLERKKLGRNVVELPDELSTFEKYVAAVPLASA